MESQKTQYPDNYIPYAINMEGQEISEEITQEEKEEKKKKKSLLTKAKKVSERVSSGVSDNSVQYFNEELQFVDTDEIVSAEVRESSDKPDKYKSKD